MHRAVLAAWLDFEIVHLAQRGHRNVRTQSSLAKGDVRFVVQVVAVALEARIIGHSQMNEEPSVGTTARARRSPIRQSHRGAFLDARGYLHTERDALGPTSLAPTVDARRLDTRAHAVAPRTDRRGHHLSEDRVAHPALLTAAVALVTRRGRGTRRTARPVAGRTSLRQRHGDLVRRAKGRIFKRDIQGDFGVGTGLGSSARLCTRTGHAAKEHVKDVLDGTRTEGTGPG